jgi:regulation of enolase protein 1 (concanavalin A-like superfamily)
VTGSVELDALPFSLSWEPLPVAAEEWRDSLRAEAAAKTDLFVDPGTGVEQLNAPRLLGPVAGDFTLAARVGAELQSTYDAAALLLWVDARTWAKLCLELAPQGKPTVVSVVTRGVSDDCNSFTTDRDEIWLRVARLGAALAFHASADGRKWELIRHFALDLDAEPQVGFLVQSPRGPGCAARFDDISFSPTRLSDIRSGE